MVQKSHIETYIYLFFSTFSVVVQFDYEPNKRKYYDDEMFRYTVGINDSEVNVDII